MATPRRERPPIDTTTVRAPVKDVAYERFLAAKTDYLRRTKVTPKNYIDFIDKALGTSIAVRGSAIVVESVENVDDFLVFQRLRELPTIFEGIAARKYEIEMLEERITNDWIDCQDFLIRRKQGARHG
jgi:hypothetical protein